MNALKYTLRADPNFRNPAPVAPKHLGSWRPPPSNITWAEWIKQVGVCFGFRLCDSLYMHVCIIHLTSASSFKEHKPRRFEEVHTGLTSVAGIILVKGCDFVATLMPQKCVKINNQLSIFNSKGFKPNENMSNTDW